MPSLSIAADFLKNYATLERSVQTGVRKVLSTFSEHTHAGIHLEKLEGARDPQIRTIRINKFWRGVVLAPDSGDTYVLLTVLPHDDAIRYAVGKVFTVNEAFGVLEARDQTALEHIEPVLRADASTAHERLFGHVKDKELIKLGIDAQILPLVRVMVSDAHLAPLANLLPEAQYEALETLAMGYTADEAWQLLCDRRFNDKPAAEIDPTDLSAAIERMPDKFTTVSGPKELADMLGNPFALWRTYLHFRQENVAYRAMFTGPALVTGGAGTGKTVTLVHRAAFLARRLHAGKSTDILVTTYTNNLADALREQLGLLVKDQNLLARIRVSTVNSEAYQIVRHHERAHPKIIDGWEKNRLWQAASRHIAGAVSAKFLESEWEQVVLAQDLPDRETYLVCERRGRGRLRVPRETVWTGISFFLDRLREKDQRTHTQIVADATRILAAQRRTHYRHVLVDEGQDLHPSQWRLLRQLVPSQPDDLFIVSDPNQRIYDNRVSLNSLGIKVRGRSKRLVVSYRTTQEILDWARKLLDKTPATGLDDEPDGLIGYRSQLHGRRPVPRRFPDRRSELTGLVEQLQQWLQDGIEPNSIGVAARTHAGVQEVREALKDAGFDQVRVETMHGMKGLEFRCGAVVGVDHDSVPLPAAVTSADDDPATHEQDTQRERCLLFVATTRHRDILYVSHVGEPSPFIPDTWSNGGGS